MYALCVSGAVNTQVFFFFFFFFYNAVNLTLARAEFPLLPRDLQLFTRNLMKIQPSCFFFFFFFFFFFSPDI